MNICTCDVRPIIKKNLNRTTFQTNAKYFFTSGLRQRAEMEINKLHLCGRELCSSIIRLSTLDVWLVDPRCKPSVFTIQTHSNATQRGSKAE